MKAELEEYQGLIEELPSIYEGKFRHQLQGVAQDVRRLLDEQQALQEQISHALAGAAGADALPAGFAAPPDPLSACEPAREAPLPAARFAGLRSRLRLPATEADSPARLRLVLLVALTTLVVAALVAVLGVWVRSRPPQLATPGDPTALPEPEADRTVDPEVDPQDVADAAVTEPADPASLRLRFNGECWLEVQTLEGEVLLVNTFQTGEERTLPIGPGLRLLAGRPDLLEVAVGEETFRTVGPIDAIDWLEIRPPAGAEGSS